MEHYVGLDVSLKLTAICIIDRTGKIEREGVVAIRPGGNLAPRSHGEPPQSGYAFSASSGKSREVHGL